MIGSEILLIKTRYTRDVSAHVFQHVISAHVFDTWFLHVFESRVRVNVFVDVGDVVYLGLSWRLLRFQCFPESDR